MQAEDGIRDLIVTGVQTCALPILQSSYNNHDPKRQRKLLLKKREINKLIGKINRDGYSLVPTKIYFNKKGIAKVQIALAKGKKNHDKRETKKNRDWEREKSRIFRKTS